MDATTMSIISGLVLLLTFAIAGWRSSRREVDRLRRQLQARDVSDGADE